MDQMSDKQLELPWKQRGNASARQRSGQASTASPEARRPGTERLMERVVDRSNMKAAWKRVRRNDGSPGVDGMTVVEAGPWLVRHWPAIREQLLAGSYRPSAIRRAVIPKDGGGERTLGIPTVIDRLVQQAILQVLQPLFDPTFSEHSYGFRPGRSAHGALRNARAYVQSGRHWVVDVDLEKFFDRVNHDVLMSRLARRIDDRRVLRLLRRFLVAGVLADGPGAGVEDRAMGTPQGGPISPLLANVLLDEVDKEMERRGHAFVRYADDLRVFVHSRRAGDRVMKHVVGMFSRLRLRVNEAKSTVDLAVNRDFLGFGFYRSPDGRFRFHVSDRATKKMKDRVRRLTRRVRGRSLEQVVESLRQYLLGWLGYFRLSETNGIFGRLDQWIRRRLRTYMLKQWQHPRTIFRELVSRGASRRDAASIARRARRWWRISTGVVNRALPNAYFQRLGLPNLST